jgi:uncharacterized repeat protein (TIGR01451 family)
VPTYSGKGTIIKFDNKKAPSLIVWKYDEITAKPLPDTEFSIAKKNGPVVYEGLTGSAGFLQKQGLEENWYVVTELAPKPGYLQSDTPSREVYLEGGKTLEVKFDNVRKPVLVFLKTNALTGKGISGATFRVEYEQPDGGIMNLGSFKTGADGRIVIPQVDPGWFIFTETLPASGFSLPKNPVTRMYVAAGQNAYLPEFEKYYGAGNAEIADNGEFGSTALTSTATEHSGSEYLVQGEGFNWPLNSIVIKKTHAITGELLPGAVFELYRADEQVSGIPGTAIGRYTTDNSGVVVITGLEPGFFVCKEVQAPSNFLISENSQQNGFLKPDGTTVLEFSFANYPYGSLLVSKMDALTGEPLAGACFKVVDGTGAVIGSTNGEYVTGGNGEILIPNVKPGAVVVTEIQAPANYTIDTTPQTIQIGTDGKTYKVSFEDHPYGAIVIRKLDGVTREPLAGVEFEIAKMSGEKVASELNGYTFTTDKNGQIYTPALADGGYVVTETRQKSGYILDVEPKTVLVESGKPTVLEVLNTPMAGLLIVKTDEATGKPLKGVVFDVTRADGQRVTGNILDGNQPGTDANSPNKATSPNGDIPGSYTTDQNGRIIINALPAGEYHVVERKALDNYELDPEVHSVTVTPGRMASLQLTNRQKAGLRLLKVDAITNAPIYNNVEFMVFDADGKVVGTYCTDNNGLIDFSGILTEGRYTIRETRPVSGYYSDDMPRTVEFVSGKVTEIRWENTPQMGQIQILKVSGDDNEVNGLPTGTPLKGAIFEIYEHKSGNLVDRIISGTDGRAVSKPLPLSRFSIKEVQAPQWYKINDQPLDVELEFATQILKLTYVNYSANTGVTIRKTGVYESMPGDVIPYTIKELRNTSTVPLTDFYWRDILPTDAVRLTRIVTGTYNQSLKYKILASTNKGDTLIIADNLSTARNNVIDCSGVSLGLASDEYVTSFTFIFGTVKAGFSIVEQPKIYVKVQPGLPNGYEFANKTDVGGKYGEWIVGKSVWTTAVYNPKYISPKLPKTGW